MKRKTIRQTVPKYILVAKVFGPIYRLLEDLLKGEVNEIEGAIVLERYKGYEAYEGIYFNASSFLTEWCVCWNKIANHNNFVIQDSSIKLLAEELSKEEVELDYSLIRQVKSEVDEMRKIWMTLSCHAIEASLVNLHDDLKAA